MAVGKGSIQRVQKAAKEIRPETATEKAAPAEVIEAGNTPRTKASGTQTAANKPAPVKKTATAKKPASSQKPKTSAGDSLHEQKFEVISGICTDLPDYLL